MYKKLILPFLFLFDPEKIHNFTFFSIKIIFTTYIFTKNIAIHSILKRKRVRDEKLKEKYPEERSDFYLDIDDKSIMFD